MDITKDNFKEFLPLIKDAIEESHFIAIDTELTGLGTDGLFNAFDTMSERYSKIQRNCSRYLVIQFGISCFKYHPKQKKYTHKDFNFYIFPKPHNSQAPDPIFTCQTASIHFLIENGFDFNKTLREGISYLTPSQEEKMREFLRKKHEYEIESLAAETNGSESSSYIPKPVTVPEEQKEFVKNISSQVEGFMSNTSESELQLEPCNSFLRKLTYQTLKKDYPKGINLSSSKNNNNDIFITVVKASSEEKAEKLKNQHTEDLNNLDDAIGFRKVLDFISEAKKLVLGHNMLLDVIHTINQFFSPLPESLEEFKELVHCVFPHLLDTKNMSSSDKFRELVSNNHLPKLLEVVQGKAFGLPTVEPEDGFKGYDINDKRLHEAGYDAFITGLCYIGLKTKLGTMQSPAIDYVSPASKIISPFVNKIHIMMHFDIPYLNLSGKDSEPNRDAVFHISFPREWRKSDIVDLFQPFGYVYVSWLNDRSALVALRNHDQVFNVTNVLLKSPSSLYKVMTFADYKNQDQGRAGKRPLERSRLDSPMPNKRRSSAGLETSSNRSIEPIPEDDENEAEKVDDSGTKLKKQKFSHEDAEPDKVSSTAKVFEEENDW